MCAWASQCYMHTFLLFFVVCSPDYSNGIMWKKQLSNNTASISCSLLHPSFWSEVYITRQCFTNRTWSHVNFSACAMRPDSSFLIMTEVRGLSIAEDATSIQDYVSEILKPLANNAHTHARTRTHTRTHTEFPILRTLLDSSVEPYTIKEGV